MSFEAKPYEGSDETDRCPAYTGAPAGLTSRAGAGGRGSLPRELDGGSRSNFCAQTIARWPIDSVYDASSPLARKAIRILAAVSS